MKVMIWAPTAILACGWLLSSGIRPQLTMPLREPLANVVSRDDGENVATDVKLTARELSILGLSEYVLRTYAPAGASTTSYQYSVYVGYYDRQTQGRTIHSPKNCLPGAGWDVLSFRDQSVNTASGPATVNRYVLQNGNARALVLYWYQGRGRVEANEYKVKANLLRDAAVHGRSEEALVRIVVPFKGTEEEAFGVASKVAQGLIPTVGRALPL